IDGRKINGVDWSGLSQEVCDRRFGIGADGLLIIDNSNISDAAMRMYNPDGTPDFCGNGIRCVARYLAEEQLGIRDPAIPSLTSPSSLPNSQPPTPNPQHPTPFTLNIATLAGVRKTVTSNPGTNHCSVNVDMSEPHFEPADIPMLVHTGPVTD